MPNELTARQAIRVWLAERDKTQRWLAREVRVTEPRLSEILSGARVVHDDEAVRIKHLTGIDIRAFERVA